VFVGALALAGYLAWQPNGVTAATWADDSSEAASAGAAGFACFAAARRSRTGRSGAWSLLGAGLAMWTVGQLVTCWYELIRGADTPLPGVADLGFLAFPPLAICAVWRLAARDGRHRHRNVLDGLILVSSLVVITWATSLGQVWATRSGSAFATGVSLAYPATDVLLATAALISVGRAPRQHRTTLRILVLGMLAMAVSDSAFSYLWTLPTFGRWQALDAGWATAFALMGLAAWSASTEVTTDGSPGGSQQTWAEIALPYLPMAAALGLLFGGGIFNGRVDPVAETAGALTVVLVFVRQLLLLADNKALVRLVQHQAFHDPLTGLANRALFADRLEHAVDLHRRDQRPFAVLFVDLDDFKAVNDTFGHPSGDVLLVLLAERLRACLRIADTISRFGGDEFAVLLEERDSDAVAVATRLLSAMETGFVIHGRTITAHLSIGVVLSDETSQQPAEYLRRADVALYEAKAAGKDTYHLYRPRLDHPVPQPR
jgi:diguanylate cyclase (GGDEF)-like protein